MLIPEWINSYIIHYKVWYEITYQFPSFNGATVEVCEWICNFIWHFIGHVITYPCKRLAAYFIEEDLPSLVKSPLDISNLNADTSVTKESNWSNWQQIITDSENGSAQIRWQAIIWSDIDWNIWCHMAILTTPQWVSLLLMGWFSQGLTTLRLRQYGRHFADNFFKHIFFKWKCLNFH